jgi:hypothetical protein
MGISFSVGQIIDRCYLNFSGITAFVCPQYQSSDPAKTVDPNPSDHALPPDSYVFFAKRRSRTSQCYVINRVHDTRWQGHLKDNFVIFGIGWVCQR